MQKYSGTSFQWFQQMHPSVYPFVSPLLQNSVPILASAPLWTLRRYDVVSDKTLAVPPAAKLSA
jgi:hypothetical protein